MTLKIVSNDRTKEVHSVYVDDGVITVVDIENGEKISLSDMDEIFENFVDTLKSCTSTDEVITKLSALNSDYGWAHVSGKI